MSDPTQHHDEPDDLDLDAETVADLEPDPQETERVAGGITIAVTCGPCQQPSGGVRVCATTACRMLP